MLYYSNNQPQTSPTTKHRLKIEYTKAREGFHITNEWTKGHQDGNKEWTNINYLQNMQLSNLVIMNT